MDKWVMFYKPFFPTREDVNEFVEEVERLAPDDPKHTAKIMMHQTQRIVSIADDLPQIRPQRESLQLLFFLICAENIAKLYDNFDGEGRSREYTRRFFEEIVSQADQDSLARAFSHFDRTPMGVREVVDLLYDVRCDVVHEGRYWGFHFHNSRTPILNTDPNVIVSLPLSELRSIVVRGCINAIQTHGGRPNPSLQPTC